ncbi:hypothetical protein GCM10009760_53320 [Kitasatospora kazusensis]|uniref:Uncharacterized protein n=1 Tax=Kitasatospora kazusensis TaxID=407974 RepID=A0ABN3A5Z3_9ACTN
MSRPAKLSGHQSSALSDRHGEHAATSRVVHRGTLTDRVIKKLCRPSLGQARTASKWIGAPGRGPVPVEHTGGVDVLQGTRTRISTYTRHPAVDAADWIGPLRRGAVDVSGHTSPPKGVGVVT